MAGSTDFSIKKRTILVDQKDEKEPADAVTSEKDKVEAAHAKATVLSPTSKPKPAAAKPAPKDTTEPSAPVPSPEQAKISELASQPKTNDTAPNAENEAFGEIPDLANLKKQYSIPIGKLKRSHATVYWIIFLLIFAIIGGVIMAAYLNPELVDNFL